ncbi:MAG TPA: hypothetical protein VFC92_09280 [Bacteroidales bacterium]|nr:hypothetical protein [Bacteroidales bacterium]
MKKQPDDLFRKLFASNLIKSDNSQTSQNQPLIRDEAFKKDFEIWKHSPEAKALHKQLLESYLARSTHASTTQIAIYTAPGAIGLTIKMPEDTDVKIYRFLLDFLREQLMTLQYSLYSSTIEEKAGAEGVQHFCERHYLKPNILNEKYPIDQLYGSIMLELELEDDGVKYLKVMSTYHTGYNYKPPQGFDALVQYLFSDKRSDKGE